MSTNNTSSNTSVPGMVYPTQVGMLAGNPRASAIAQGNINTQKLVALNKIGGKQKYRRRGGATTTATSSSSNITVPQYSMQYKSQGGLGQDPNSIIKQNASIGTQGSANAVYDKYATQMGGVYMNPNTNQYQWGCYSGGKTRKRRKINKKKRTKTKAKKRSKKRSIRSKK
jgi:hypothetical protein